MHAVTRYERVGHRDKHSDSESDSENDDIGVVSQVDSCRVLQAKKPVDVVVMDI